MKRTRPLQTASKRVVQVSQKFKPCVRCHKKSHWLSVEGLCWECLKSTVKGKKPQWDIEPPDLFEEGTDNAPDWSPMNQ